MSATARAGRAWQSTVGKKFIMAISGILLIGFLIVHLGGNLTMLVPDDGRSFNLYSYKLHTFQPWLNIARAGLAALFLVHIVSGIRVYLQNRRGRGGDYAVTASKGGPSRMSTASLWMARTGLVLFIFVPIHVRMFSMGPYYSTVVDGVPMRDLYTLVVEKFNDPLIAFAYAGVMLLLGMHLRHGFWSALQSLGVMSPRLSPAIHSFGLVFAALLVVGFVLLPLYIFFLVPMPEAVAMGGSL